MLAARDAPSNRIVHAALLPVLVACSAESARGSPSEAPAPSARVLRSAPPNRVVAAPLEVTHVREAAPSSVASSKRTASCDDASVTESSTYSEPGGRKRRYSVDGYLARTIAVAPPDERDPEAPACVTVLWPAGEANNDGGRSHVAQFIGEPWFRLIQNTLARIPAEHVATLRRVVIDNRPKEHGIASHDRQDPEDARDGRTIWLHEHLFRDPNHWARGTRGRYFSYHLSENDRTLEGAAPDHDLFSPVLLHEVGHLVMYNIVNATRVGRARAVVPKCAETCVDDEGCTPSARALEAGCVTPYCTPFRYRTSTENWAEQYRFYYQSSATRALLGPASAGCLEVLAGQEQTPNGEPLGAPWTRGLPDGPPYERSLWDSCGGRACKAW